MGRQSRGGCCLKTWVWPVGAALTLSIRPASPILSSALASLAARLPQAVFQYDEPRPAFGGLQPALAGEREQGFGDRVADIAADRREDVALAAGHQIAVEFGVAAQHRGGAGVVDRDEPMAAPGGADEIARARGIFGDLVRHIDAAAGGRPVHEVLDVVPMGIRGGELAAAQSRLSHDPTDEGGRPGLLAVEAVEIVLARGAPVEADAAGPRLTIVFPLADVGDAFAGLIEPHDLAIEEFPFLLGDLDHALSSG